MGSEGDSPTYFGGEDGPAEPGTSLPSDEQATLFDEEARRLLDPGTELPPELAAEQRSVYLRAGDVVAGRFQVVKLLGFGGMGAVYHVKDRELHGQDRALKVMLPSLLRSDSARERFLCEVNISQKLNHDGIVRVHDLGLDPGRGFRFFTMEYVEGKTLHRVLKDRGGKLLVDEALEITRQLCDILEYAHRRTVHRDLKPQNIMVEPDGGVKILDFGLAKVMSPGRMTRSSMALGTAYYQAPEQSVQLGEVDQRADIYSTGVIFYELLTGALPVGRFKLPSELDSELSERCDQVVVGCLEPRPEDRFSDVGALREAIDGCAGALVAAEEAREAEARRGEQARREEEEARRRAEEQRRQEDEARKRAAEEQRRAVEALRLEEEARRQTEHRDRAAREARSRRAGRKAAMAACVVLAALAVVLTVGWLLAQDYAPRQVSPRPTPQPPAAPEPKPKPGSSPPAEVPSNNEDYVEDLGAGVTLEMVWIPPGEFMMGSKLSASEVARKYGGEAKYFEGEVPRHKVTITGGFWLGKYEVTNAQYRRRQSSHSSGEYKGHSLDGADQPVVEVSWEDAKAFCKWVSEKTGRPYGLPTEAQWEYACRAGTDTVRYWGDDDASMGQYANVYDRTGKEAFNFDWESADTTDGFKVSAPVGRFKANAFGLYDMIGNVWEWCADWYDEDYYGSSPSKNPTGPTSGSSRVLRGGSWIDSPRYCRSANRYRSTPGNRYLHLGFRLAASPAVR